jgi:hypothetical protein
MIAVLLAAASGCNKREFIPIEGRVTAGGKPLVDVKVTFLPDSLAGNDGNTAEGITDADGRYKLMSPRDKQAGTVTGPHRVVLIDLHALPALGGGSLVVQPPEGAAEAPRKKAILGQPRRFPGKYESPRETPFRDVIVDSAHRTFDFDVEPMKKGDS